MVGMCLHMVFKIVGLTSPIMALVMTCEIGHLWEQQDLLLAVSTIFQIIKLCFL
jgi:hypothetical protein